MQLGQEMYADLESFKFPTMSHFIKDTGSTA